VSNRNTSNHKELVSWDISLDRYPQNQRRRDPYMAHQFYADLFIKMVYPLKGPMDVMVGYRRGSRDHVLAHRQLSL
jgi:hypothetical protein